MGVGLCQQTCPSPVKVPADDITLPRITQSAILDDRPCKKANTTADQDAEDLRQDEKARLKLMVRTFASEAMNGVPCTALNLDTGETAPAVYLIDRSMTELTLRPNVSIERLAARSLRFSSINDVLRHKDLADHSSLRSMHGIASLSAAHRQQLVVVLFVKDDGRDGFMGFLQEDSQTRDAFVTSLNILRVYREVLATR